MVHSNCRGVLRHITSTLKKTQHPTLDNFLLSIRTKGNFLERSVMFGEKSFLKEKELYYFFSKEEDASQIYTQTYWLRNVTSQAVIYTQCLQ